MIPWRVLLNQLRRAWFRTILTAEGVALAIVLMCTLGIVTTSLEQTVKAAGGNRLIVSSAVSLFVFVPQKIERPIVTQLSARDSPTPAAKQAANKSDAKVSRL